MKKLVAVLCIIACIIALCSCSLLFAPSEDDLTWAKQTSGENIFSFNVNVITYIEYNEKGEASLKCELETVTPNGAFSEDEINEIVRSTAIELNFSTQYQTYYAIVSSLETYDCYNFKLNWVNVDFEYSQSDYGFFYVKHFYALENPRWINSLLKEIITQANDVIAKSESSERRIDNMAHRLRYFLMTDVELVADDAQRVYKTIGSDNLMYETLMWETISYDYGFAEFDVAQSSMASGWFVVSIILGVIAVGIIMIAAPKNGKSDFSLQSTSVDAEPFVEIIGDDKLSEPIANQISMEEFADRIGNSSEDTDGR